MAFSLFTHKIEHVQPNQVLALFAQVEDKPWSFLLDSCQQTHMDGRYDIIVSAPCLTYEFTRGKHSLCGDFTDSLVLKSYLHINDFPSFLPNSFTQDCPFERLAQIQSCFNSLFNIAKIAQYDLPFIVGALSVFAYDGNTSSDNIKDDDPSQYNLPDISVGFYHSSIVYDNKTKTLHVFSINEAFIGDTKSRLAAADAVPLDVKTFSLLEPWQSNMSKAFYFEQFAKIEEYLRAGDCYQVNFAQRFHARYEGSEWGAYCHLRKENNAPFSAYVRLPTSVVLSLSPERFLRVNDAQVETKPIKGTRKRDPDPIVDKALSDELLSAEKDRAENLMIVDLLRNDLSKYCKPHSVKVPALFVLESYPAVHHMVSTVVGELKDDASVFDLLKGAFPGGSITGAPKVRSMQIIQELEPDKRAIYCGTIGYTGIRGDMDTNICIRTLLAQPNGHDSGYDSGYDSGQTNDNDNRNTLYCWAGGGIVIDSQNFDEYLESLHKVAKILPVLENIHNQPNKDKP